MSDKEFTMILGSLRRSLEELSRWIARASTARNNEVYDAEHVLHRLSVAACGVFELTEQAIAMTSAEASDHLLSIRHALEDLEALGIGHGARPSASLPSVVLNAIPMRLPSCLQGRLNSSSRRNRPLRHGPLSAPKYYALWSRACSLSS